MSIFKKEEKPRVTFDPCRICTKIVMTESLVLCECCGKKACDYCCNKRYSKLGEYGNLCFMCRRKLIGG